MVGMMEFYRVRLPPTIITRVRDADRHHACVVDGVEARWCGRITRAYRVHATEIFCRREKWAAVCT
jgi:hypothetical protein